MVKEAVLHKMNQENAFYIGNDRFVIRVRTKKNDVEKVNLFVTDKYLYLHGRAGFETFSCKKVASDRLFDYYEGIIESKSLVIKYYFEFIDMSQTACYYGAYEFFDEPIKDLKFIYDIPSRNLS